MSDTKSQETSSAGRGSEVTTHHPSDLESVQSVQHHFSEKLGYVKLMLTSDTEHFRLMGRAVAGRAFTLLCEVGESK